jgi:hypothetical protein
MKVTAGRQLHNVLCVLGVGWSVRSGEGLARVSVEAGPTWPRPSDCLGRAATRLPALTVSVVDWRVYLDGDSTDLLVLCSTLAAGDVVVKQDDDGIYLGGPALACASAPAQALLRATELLPRLNAVGRVIDATFEPVRTSGRVSDADQPATVFAEAHLRARARLSVGGEPVAAQRMLDRAQRDQAFDEVLQLLGASSELDWVDLYKLYELLAHDAGDNDAFCARAGISLADLKAFKASANRPDVSGSAARHAVARGGMPSRMMTLEEARALILSVVRIW